MEWTPLYSSIKDIPLKEPEGDEVIFLGERFKIGEKPGVFKTPIKYDVERNLREIQRARREADWVLVSYHSHEGSIEDSRLPAPFARKFSQDCIDAGADAVFGHGYHENRGIEIYKGKPIFHSLGTFINHMETLLRHPYDAYEKLGLDPARATSADVIEAKYSWRRDMPHPWWFKSVIAVFNLGGEGLGKFKLFPVNLMFEKPPSQRGRPILADEKLGKEIIERFKLMSAPFGTKIEFREGIGIVKI